MPCGPAPRLTPASEGRGPRNAHSCRVCVKKEHKVVTASAVTFVNEWKLVQHIELSPSPGLVSATLALCARPHDSHG